MTRKPESVLIIRLSAIGDVVHALPVLDVLRASLPQARIGWLVEELAAPLLQHHPALDHVYTVPLRRWKKGMMRSLRPEILPYIRRVRQDGWEAAVDMQGITKSGAVSWLSGAKRRVGFGGENSRELNRLLMNRRVTPHEGDIHVVEQNVRLLEGLGIRVPARIPRGEIHFLPEERTSMQAKLAEAGWNEEPLLAVNGGAGFPSKLWDPDRYAALADYLAGACGLRPIVFWGPREEHLRDHLVAALSHRRAFAAPPTTVRESAVLTGFSRLFLGGDTGPTQIAGILGVPAIAVFGATSGPRNHPWPGSEKRELCLYIQREDLDCCPCRKRRCPLPGDRHLACLRGLDPSHVQSRVEKWLEDIQFSAE